MNLTLSSIFDDTLRSHSVFMSHYLPRSVSCLHMTLSDDLALVYVWIFLMIWFLSTSDIVWRSCSCLCLNVSDDLVLAHIWQCLLIWFLSTSDIIWWSVSWLHLTLSDDLALVYMIWLCLHLPDRCLTTMTWPTRCDIFCFGSSTDRASARGNTWLWQGTKK